MLHADEYAALRSEVDRMWKLPPMPDPHAGEARGRSRTRTFQLDKGQMPGTMSSPVAQEFYGLEHLPLPALTQGTAGSSGAPSTSSQIVSGGGHLGGSGGGGGSPPHPVVENLLETAMAFRRAALERSSGQASTSGRDVGPNLIAEQIRVRAPGHTHNPHMPLASSGCQPTSGSRVVHRLNTTSQAPAPRPLRALETTTR